jgi:pteridine reductase
VENLTDKVALVTGAARRVGRVVALELARAGSHVAIHFNRSADAARELAGEVRAMGRRVTLVQGDLMDHDTPRQLVGAVVSALGRLDVLVNNASIFPRTPLGDIEWADWERVFRVNLFAPAMLCQRVAPYMRQAGSGRIVNFVDILAERPIRRYGPYCASKAALVSLTRSLARELAPEITVNAIAPGIAVFPEEYSESLRRELIDRVPLKRAGTPEDMARLVRFLVTEGGYITGQIVPVDGGRSVVP